MPTDGFARVRQKATGHHISIRPQRLDQGKHELLRFEDAYRRPSYKTTLARAVREEPPAEDEFDGADAQADQTGHQATDTEGD